MPVVNLPHRLLSAAPRHDRHTGNAVFGGALDQLVGEREVDQHVPLPVQVPEDILPFELAGENALYHENQDEGSPLRIIPE